MFVGVCRLALVAPHCHSLKEKRQVVRALTDKIRARFDVKLAEVDGQDTWQRIELGFAVVTTRERSALDAVEKVVAYVDGMGLARLVGDRREVIAVDGPAASPDPDPLDGWIPDAWAAEVGEEDG